MVTIWVLYFTHHTTYGGVSGVEVISLILKYVKWDDEVKNVSFGLITNAVASGIGEEVCMAILEIIPCNE